MVRSRQGRAGRGEQGSVVVRRPVWNPRRRPAAATGVSSLARRVAARRPGRPAVLGALGLVVVLAAATALRAWGIGSVRVNPFYDAAVRSMGLSWHNFFYGALEPGGRISVDKPPIDLWLQVASTKLAGFSTTGLLLPEALGGIVAPGLLFATIRPVFGTLAATLAGLALAVLPISVVTSRSDTMDSVMMALLIGALWASVRGLRTRRIRWVVVAAVIVGVAFNVKLSEALVPLPALALIWWGVARGWRHRLAAAAAAATTMVVVGMLWIFLASLTAVGDRPYPIGSRNGSIYQAVFVYNGLERLNGTSVQVAPVASASPSGPTRLVMSDHPFYGQRIGLELVAALALAVACGLAALGTKLGRRLRRRPSRRRRRRVPRLPPTARAAPAAPAAPDAPDAPATPAARDAPATPASPATPAARDAPATPATPATVDATPADAEVLPATTVAASADDGAGTPSASAPAATARESYARGWLIVGLMAWLVTGVFLFSAVRDLVPRYLEAVSPAVAGTFGIACAALLRRARAPGSALALTLALAASAAFALSVGSVPTAALIVGVAASVVAIVALLAARRRLRPALLGLAVTTALLAAPIGVSVELVANNATAAGTAGAGDQFSAYLKAHRHGAYYEVASASVYAVTTLIEKDAQPVLVLNDFHGPIVPLGKLRDLVRRGAVRHIVISHACRSGPHCPLTTRWSLKHAREVVKGGLWEYILPLKPDKPRPRGPFASLVLGGSP